jgi:hypothetical protein
VEKDLASGRKPDETVALSNQQLHDTAGACRAASFRRSRCAFWRRLSAGGLRRLRHSGYQRGSRRRPPPP